MIIYTVLDTDACTVPVLTPKEAGEMTSTSIPIFHPHVSKEPTTGQYLNPKSIVIQPGQHTDAVLQDFGIDSGRVEQLKDEGVFGKDSRRVLVSSKL